MIAPPIQPRPIAFDIPDSVPRHWHGGDPVKTHFLDAFSCLLPVYERFFISVMRENLGRISDPRLLSAARAFCVQEGAHSREHGKYNRWLLEQGYRKLPFFERVHAALLAVERRILPEDWLLALTVGGEHITAYMGRAYLTDPAKWSDRSHPAMRRIWSWHAVEEIEHKAVCFDVFQKLRGGRLLRCAAFIAVNLQSFGAVGLICLYLLHADGLLRRPGVWRALWTLLLGRDGFLKKTVAEGRDFLRPDFHPWQRDERGLIERWDGSIAG